MTGVSPATSGVYQDNQDWRECSRFKNHITLPQHFRNHGYKVIGGLKPAANLEGQSLKPLLLEPTAESDRLACTTFRPSNHSVRSQDWRYIRCADGSEELYDHRELNNVAGLPQNKHIKLRLATGMPMQNAEADPAPTKRKNIQ